MKGFFWWVGGFEAIGGKMMGSLTSVESHESNMVLRYLWSGYMIVIRVL